jgi:hypothetical protein
MKWLECGITTGSICMPLSLRFLRKDHVFAVKLSKVYFMGVGVVKFLTAYICLAVGLPTAFLKSI